MLRLLLLGVMLCSTTKKRICVKSKSSIGSRMFAPSGVAIIFISSGPTEARAKSETFLASFTVGVFEISACDYHE